MLISFIPLGMAGLALAAPIPAPVPQFGGFPSFPGTGGGTGGFPSIPSFPGTGGGTSGFPSFPGTGGGGFPSFPGSGGGGFPSFPGTGGGGLPSFPGTGSGGGFPSIPGFPTTPTLPTTPETPTDPESPTTPPSSGSGCSSYTIINTRGTGEPQGPSTGFRTMNANVIRAVPGGTVYSTVYPAGFSQNSAAGTSDILRQISSGLQRNPGQCFILEGYSQGAAATVNALDEIPASDPRFDAVKGVFLIGNPEHKAGLACNVDMDGGASTRNVNGISSFGGGIPAAWVSKTLDVCNRGDGICDSTGGFGVNAQHLAYSGSAGTQRQGTEFITARLKA